MEIDVVFWSAFPSTTPSLSSVAVTCLLADDELLRALRSHAVACLDSFQGCNSLMDQSKVAADIRVTWVEDESRMSFGRNTHIIKRNTHHGIGTLIKRNFKEYSSWNTHQKEHSTHIKRNTRQKEL